MTVHWCLLEFIIKIVQSPFTPLSYPSLQYRVESCPPLPPGDSSLLSTPLRDRTTPITPSTLWLTAVKEDWFILIWRTQRLNDTSERISGANGYRDGKWVGSLRCGRSQHFVLSSSISCSVTVPPTASYRTVPPSGIQALHQVPKRQ